MKIRTKVSVRENPAREGRKGAAVRQREAAREEQKQQVAICIAAAEADGKQPVPPQSLARESREYLCYCREEKRLSAGTLRVYRYDMNAFRASIEVQLGEKADAIDVCGICREHLQTFIGEENEKWEVKTVKRRIACLKGFFSFLEDEKVIDQNPFDKVRARIRETKKLPNTMDMEEVTEILQAAYRDRQPCYYRAMDKETVELVHLRDIAVLELLFATGLRVQELCDLTTDTLDLKERKIKILGKGRKERIVYIGSDDVAEALKSYLGQRRRMGFDSVHIFVNKWGGTLSCQAVRTLVSKYAGLAGLSHHVTPHAFRHTFATLLIEEGVDIKYIQEFLGHSSISTTQIYLHLSEQKKKEVLVSKHPRQKLSVHEAH